MLHDTLHTCGIKQLGTSQRKAWHSRHQQSPGDQLANNLITEVPGTAQEVPGTAQMSPLRLYPISQILQSCRQ